MSDRPPPKFMIFDPEVTIDDIPVDRLFGKNVKDNDDFREFAEYCRVDVTSTECVMRRFGFLLTRKVMRIKRKRGPRTVRYQTVVMRDPGQKWGDELGFNPWLTSKIDGIL